MRPIKILGFVFILCKMLSAAIRFCMVFKWRILSGFVSGAYKLYNQETVLLDYKWDYFTFSEMNKLWKKKSSTVI